MSEDDDYAITQFKLVSGEIIVSGHKTDSLENFYTSRKKKEIELHDPMKICFTNYEGSLSWMLHPYFPNGDSETISIASDSIISYTNVDQDLLECYIDSVQEMYKFKDQQRQERAKDRNYH